MVYKPYSIGVMAAYIFIMIGALIYIRHKDIEALGAKMSIFGAAILLAIVWPISVPASIGFALKAAGSHIVGLITEDAYQKVDEQVKE